MLRTTQRISRDSFPEVAKKGRRYSADHLSLTFSPAPEGGGVSFVVGKAVAKKASDRNLLKRRGYGSIQAFGFGSGPFPWKAIFFYKKGALGLTFKQIEMEIRVLLREAGVLPRD